MNKYAYQLNNDILYLYYLKSVLGKYFLAVELDSNLMKKDLIPKISLKKEDIVFVSKFLKKHSLCQFEQLLDVTAVDYPNKKDRFELLYQYLSVRNSKRILIKIATSLKAQSLTALYPSSTWLEREVWDLFGIFFFGHPDLRRILTDYGFNGFPLRKDFPLSGYVEVRYDDEKRRVVQESLEVSQEFRLFNFSSPWKKLI